MENNEITKTNKVKVIVITLLIFIVSIAGISYAYFTIQITGNDTASSMRLTTANMSLIYNDVQIVSGEHATPGWTQTKTLTVTNNGNVTAYYTIIWRDLYNEVTNNELVISATCSSTSGSCPTISETVVPTTNPEGHNINVKQNIEIPVGATHTYTLTALFKETGSNQNYNQDKQFYGTLNIAEGKEPVSIVRTGTDTTTGLPLVRIGTEEFYDITNAIDYSTLVSTNGNIYNYAANKSILLARYNLNKTTNIQTTSTYSGVYAVTFSGVNYWYDITNDAIYLKYGTVYNGNNVYDTDYQDATGTNYSIAYYVEEYISSLGIDGIGRLLTYTESNAMTQAERTNDQNYWLGSAIGSNYLYHVRTDGILRYYGYNDVGTVIGVRPVIVVNTSDIQSS